MTAFRALIGLLLITLACASSPQYFHAARADDPKFDPAKIRADLEKSRADAE